MLESQKSVDLERELRAKNVPSGAGAATLGATALCNASCEQLDSIRGEGGEYVPAEVASEAFVEQTQPLAQPPALQD